MRRRPSVLSIAFVAGWSAATAASPAWQAAPLFRAETRLIVLHATVRNSRGTLITTLQRDAFRVYENGKPQTIALFRRDDVPVSVGLVIDNSGSMRAKRSRVEAAALAFARASNPDDELFVTNFADRSRLDVPMTHDLAALEAGIARADSIGGTAMRDAISAAESYLQANATRDRKVLLVITDGYDNASVTPIDAVLTPAEQRGITIYAIGLLAGADPGRAKQARHELERLTGSTGGLAYYAADIDQVDRAALEIARQIRNQYTIAYSPLNQALDGTYRRIRVDVRGSESLAVVTRAGYRATAEVFSKPLVP